MIDINQIAHTINDDTPIDIAQSYHKMKDGYSILSEPFSKDLDISYITNGVDNMIESYLYTKFPELTKDDIKSLKSQYGKELSYLITMNAIIGMRYKEEFDRRNINVVP